MRTRVPPLPKSRLKPAVDRSRKLAVGDKVDLGVLGSAPVVRRGPWKGTEGITLELPDGTRHTFHADRFERP